MPEQTRTSSPPSEFSEEFMTRVRRIWRERSFTRDNKEEWLRQIRNALDDYVMIATPGTHPTAILESMHVYTFQFDRFLIYDGWNLGWGGTPV